MKLLKSPLRNRMGSELLNALCRLNHSVYGVRVPDIGLALIAQPRAKKAKVNRRSLDSQLQRQDCLAEAAQGHSGPQKRGHVLQSQNGRLFTPYWLR